jgi:hypothetical protein
VIEIFINIIMGNKQQKGGQAAVTGRSKYKVRKLALILGAADYS